MQKEFTVTDLTRFKERKVCLAGVVQKIGGLELIRPVPYLTSEECIDQNIYPGKVISADITPVPDAKPPHIEDCFRRNWQIVGEASPPAFQSLLENTVFSSVSAGFGVQVSDKVIPLKDTPCRSIITIKPTSIQVFPGYGNDYRKMSATIVDQDGLKLKFLPVQDLYLNLHLQEISDPVFFNEFNILLNRSTEIYVRLGVGRPFENQDGREGYWLQVNAIYTFPDAWRTIR